MTTEDDYTPKAVLPGGGWKVWRLDGNVWDDQVVIGFQYTPMHGWTPLVLDGTDFQNTIEYDDLVSQPWYLDHPDAEYDEDYLRMTAVDVFEQRKQWKRERGA